MRPKLGLAWKGQAWAPPPANLQFVDGPNAIHQFKLHWTHRKQPDNGGALEYSFDSYQRPIKEMLGTAIAPTGLFRPIGQAPMIPVLMRPEAGMGVFTGGIVHQPLTDPNGVNPGGMTGLPDILSKGLA